MWSQSIRYLGVHVLAGKTISFDMNPAKRSFYLACNSILSHSSNLEEVVQLRLQELCSLPILTYCIAAFDLKVKQLAELNVCWNSVYRRLFGFHKWESVRTYHGLYSFCITLLTYSCVHGTVPASTHCTASSMVGRGPIGRHISFP